MTSKSLIGYARVSTSQQGRSGLGIEAQREALERFAASEGFTLGRVFVEVETGKGADVNAALPMDRAPARQRWLIEARPVEAEQPSLISQEIDPPFEVGNTLRRTC